MILRWGSEDAALAARGRRFMNQPLLILWRQRFRDLKRILVGMCGHGECRSCMVDAFRLGASAIELAERGWVRH